MDRDLVEQISRQVARSFPEMSRVKPTVRRQDAPSGAPEQFLLVYKGTANLPGGRTMARVVRVVADERGRILKISTSK